ncbi:MAG: hypothetical protein WCY21_05390 [Candidatus Cloacimonadaceae bacterium]
MFLNILRDFFQQSAELRGESHADYADYADLYIAYGSAGTPDSSGRWCQIHLAQ